MFCGWAFWTKANKRFRARVLSIENHWTVAIKFKQKCCVHTFLHFPTSIVLNKNTESYLLCTTIVFLFAIIISYSAFTTSTSLNKYTCNLKYNTLTGLCFKIRLNAASYIPSMNLMEKRAFARNRERDALFVHKLSQFSGCKIICYQIINFCVVRLKCGINIGLQ